MSHPPPAITRPSPSHPILATRPNLRSLGGVPASAGRRIGEGVLYRAPALGDLAPEEAAAVAALDLALVIDFRQPSEVAATPVHLAARPDATRLALPIRTVAADSLLAATPSAAVEAPAARAAMADVYRDFVRLNADTFADFLVASAAAPGAVLFHCTAGKDRTGFAAALALSALGAPRDAVMDDYLATAALWTPDGFVAQIG